MYICFYICCIIQITIDMFVCVCYCILQVPFKLEQFKFLIVNPSSVNTIRVGRTDDPTNPITITPTLSQPIQLECERSDKMKEWFTVDPMSRVITTRGEISLRSEQDSTLYISSFNPFHGKGYTCNVYGDSCSITAYPVILGQ